MYVLEIVIVRAYVGAWKHEPDGMMHMPGSLRWAILNQICLAGVDRELRAACSPLKMMKVELA